MHPGSDFTPIYPQGISVGLCSLIGRAIALDEGIPSPFADAPSGISRYFMLSSIAISSLMRLGLKPPSLLGPPSFWGRHRCTIQTWEPLYSLASLIRVTFLGTQCMQTHRHRFRTQGQTRGFLQNISASEATNPLQKETRLPSLSWALYNIGPRY
jgi:hypothetical protein